MPYAWEGNCRSEPVAKGLSDGDEHPGYARRDVWHCLHFVLSGGGCRRFVEKWGRVFAHLDEQFLQFSGLGFVTLGPFHCAYCIYVVIL